MEVNKKKKLLCIVVVICCLSMFVSAYGKVVWLERSRLNVWDVNGREFFGRSASISGDYVIAGADGGQSGGIKKGAAYVFKRKGDNWVKQAKLTASDGKVEDKFGGSVSISGDYAVIGAQYHEIDGLINTGAAYLFKRGGAGWREVEKLTAAGGKAYDHFGSCVFMDAERAISGAHQAQVNGLEGAGSAYIFEHNGAKWAQQRLSASDASEEDWFGCCVCISGRYAIVGAKYDDVRGVDNCGSAYVFFREPSGWVEQGKLVAKDARANDWFGGSVAISGNYVIVGACGADVNGLINAGAVYIFERNGTRWVLRAKLTAFDSAADDEFGSSVSINDDIAVAGAHQHQVGELVSAGATYVFKRDESDWMLQDKLTASIAGANDKFGESVSVSAGRVVAGAPRNDAKASNSGAAYVFERRSSSVRN